MDTPRRSYPLHSGQVVVVQLGAVLLALGWLAGRSRAGWLAVPVAAVLAGLALGRLRGRWLYQWLGTALGYLCHRRALPRGGDFAAFVAAGRPDPGPIAVAELTGCAPTLGTGGVELPGPAALAARLPAGIGVRLVVSAVPALAGGPVGASYRELTGGRVPARLRALLVLRGAGAERAVRQLGLPYALVDPAATAAELAGHDPDRTGREGWSALRLGGRCHRTLRVDRPVGADGLLCVPAARVTLGLTGQYALVRLTAADPAGLDRAERALRQRVPATPLPGDQLAGLAGTLPLGRSGPDPPALRGRVPDRPEERIRLPVAGLMLGRDRHGTAVTAALFAPRPVLAVLAGDPGTARVLVLRALAVRARVAIRTGRPAAWVPLVDALGLPGDVLALLPPRVPGDLPVPGPDRPRLEVVDAPGAEIGGNAPLRHDPAPAVPAPRPPESAWTATLLLRDRLAEPDQALLRRADLAILPPLSTAEADLAGAALGLGTGRNWLTRIRPGMFGLVSGRSVRWALLCPTELERRLAAGHAAATAG